MPDEGIDLHRGVGPALLLPRSVTRNYLAESLLRASRALPAVIYPSPLPAINTASLAREDVKFSDMYSQSAVLIMERSTHIILFPPFSLIYMYGNIWKPGIGSLLRNTLTTYL